jgi:hypothetical protein
MHEIFGVYKSKKEATEAVWRFFGSDEYELMFDCDECPHCNELFKYVDKEYGVLHIMEFSTTQNISSYDKFI